MDLPAMWEAQGRVVDADNDGADYSFALLRRVRVAGEDLYATDCVVLCGEIE
jgi:hypothetical protein